MTCIDKTLPLELELQFGDVAGMREEGGGSTQILMRKVEKADSGVLFGYIERNEWVPV